MGQKASSQNRFQPRGERLPAALLLYTNYLPAAQRWPTPSMPNNFIYADSRSSGFEFQTANVLLKYDETVRLVRCWRRTDDDQPPFPVRRQMEAELAVLVRMFGGRTVSRGMCLDAIKVGIFITTEVPTALGPDDVHLMGRRWVGISVRGACRRILVCWRVGGSPKTEWAQLTQESAIRPRTAVVRARDSEAEIEHFSAAPCTRVGTAPTPDSVGFSKSYPRLPHEKRAQNSMHSNRVLCGVP